MGREHRLCRDMEVSLADFDISGIKYGLWISCWGYYLAFWAFLLSVQAAVYCVLYAYKACIFLDSGSNRRFARYIYSGSFVWTCMVEG